MRFCLCGLEKVVVEIRLNVTVWNAERRGKK